MEECPSLVGVAASLQLSIRSRIMEPDRQPLAHAQPARPKLVGTIVATWALLDPLIGIVIVILAAWLRPWVVFIVAAVVLTVINTSLCTWVDRWWDLFVAGPGQKIEARLEKMRRGRIMRHPVQWITEGSAFWYSLAAMLTNAITCVCIARVVGGAPIGRRRVRLAALSFSVFEAGLFALIGWAMGDVIRAM